MNRSGLLKLILLTLSLAATVAGLAACKRSNGQTNATANASATPTVVQVSTSAAISRQLPRYLEGTGSLAANEQTDVAAETSGKVAAIGIDIGSWVNRSQMLVRLADADFEDRVAQAQAQLDQFRFSIHCLTISAAAASGRASRRCSAALSDVRGDGRRPRLLLY